MRESLRAQGIQECMLSEEEMDFALGRGPPCSACGHVCHLSYVRMGCAPRSPRYELTLHPLGSMNLLWHLLTLSSTALITTGQNNVRLKWTARWRACDTTRNWAPSIVAN